MGDNLHFKSHFLFFSKKGRLVLNHSYTEIIPILLLLTFALSLIA
uniref:Uncharacterized protein n=1 Tax=Rhizophora mucronata TaxID=61149 RepID=A0A2P2PVQ9_RHIMU